MNANYDNELEAQIDRELKSLPRLAAPKSLVPRVMAMIDSRAAVPWYGRAWQTWPISLRTASFVMLLVFFGGVCFAGWNFSHAPGVTAATQKVSGVFATIGVAWKTLGVLGDAVVQVIYHFGTGFIIALVALVLLGYAMCVGLGSAWYRLVYASR